MKKRKLPVRKCIACGQGEDKKNLFRIVRSPEGSVSLDLTGKKNGRGAYLSKNKECIDLAQKKKLLSKQLQAEVDKQVFEEMYQYLEKSHSENG